ncbi:MAG: hypothetical protein ACI9TH_000557 [Kiritimatiellia bacterium]|jgi:hypothetical protein
MKFTSPARSGFAEIPALLLEDFFGIGAASEGEGIGEIAHPETQQISQVKLAVFCPDLLDFLAGGTAAAAAIWIGLPHAVQELAIGSLDHPPFGAPPQAFAIGMSFFIMCPWCLMPSAATSGLGLSNQARSILMRSFSSLMEVKY